MGNEVSRRKSMKSAKKPNYLDASSNIDKLIESDLKQIELKINNLGKGVELCKQFIRINHDSLYNNISYYLSNEGSYRVQIAKKRIELISKLNQLMKREDFLRVRFRECSKHLDEILLTFSVNVNFNLLKKISYAKLYSNCQKISVSQCLAKYECYNYLIMPMSRSKIFYCLGMFYKKSFILIADRNCNELHKRAIHKSLYYQQFLCHGAHVIGLYDDVASSMQLLEFYNDQLNVLSARRFNHKIELLYMNKHEIVYKCQVDAKIVYVFLDFGLKQTFSLSFSSTSANDNNNGHHSENHSDNNSNNYSDDELTLLASNKHFVYVFMRRKQVVKKVDRFNGQAFTVLDLNKVDDLQAKHVSIIKMDSECLHLVVKSSQPDCIRIFDLESNVFRAQKLHSLDGLGNNSLEMTHSNDFYSCDLLNKLIYFY